MTDPSSPIAVRHYCPGGREHGGGIGRLVGYVADAAAGRGTRHAVCDTRGPRWSPSSLLRLGAAAGVMVWDRAIAPERVHHIHVAGRGSTLRKLLLCRVARAIGCRHVLHLHDYDYAADYARRPAWAKRAIQRMFQGADQVIVLGQRDWHLATSMLAVDPERVTLLQNCVPDPGPRTGTASNPPLILFLGRLSSRKGVPDLLAALARPAMASLAWSAVLAGDGPVEEFRAEAAALGLSGRVTMPGWLGEDDVRRLCAAADILVLPSQAEGLAMAVVEGLAHGIAVVTTRVGAHEEVITDGMNGLFVPVGAPDALAEAMAGLIATPERRGELARHGRETFLERFSMGTYLSRLQPVYDAATEPVADLRPSPERGRA